MDLTLNNLQRLVSHKTQATNLIYMYVIIYVYSCVFVCVYIYIYIYTLVVIMFRTA